MIKTIYFLALLLLSSSATAETVACVFLGHIFIKDGEASSTAYKAKQSSENIKLFQFSDSAKSFTVDWNLPNKKETLKLIGETSNGYKIYLGGMNNLNIATVNKDKTEVHWLHAGRNGGSTTVLNCTH